jgi:mannose-1-phosphate guanylyltransferase/mannose-1-phosphate guanylyltransferase/mannose-6-phosphate isomerase
MMIVPVILCGGSGTRLWPVSRKSFPKQFAPLLGAESLFQATLRRLQRDGFAAPVILTNADFRFLVTDQMAGLGLSDGRVIIEPAGRNTAPAVLTAALSLEDDPETILLVAPSDHVIRDEQLFAQAVQAGARAAAGGRMVTFGIMPDRAETGYGYLELGTKPGFAPPTAQPLLRFVEKPDAARAAALVASGLSLWNAGIFMFRVGDILSAFENHAPDLIAPCRQALRDGKADLGFFRLDSAAYERARDISIDYAVMEKSGNLSVVPFSGGWNDLGSWDAIWRESKPDAKGNVSAENTLALDCTNTLLRSEEGNLQLVGLGLDNIAVIAMRDAVLVADMSKSQSVKQAVDALKGAGVAQAVDYPRFHRPWGWYETLSLGARFQVKRIMVKPGGVLSLQSHVHRAEHWVVVEGTARVTIGEDVRLITENQSVYIPLGTVHRMENPGKVPMFLIEVQSGTYLGEDDIVRYEDIYART